MKRKKVGLALGSGAARAMAHIGVLEVLVREGIPIDLIAGTSAGAVVGALYAQGRQPGQIKRLVRGLGWKGLAPLVDPSIPRTGLVKGKKLKDLLKLYFGGDIRFSDLKIPLACVATDINTGEEVVIDRGPVLEALRASFSIPGIFTVVNHQGRYLVDGQLVNPVPVSVARSMGADFVIAVNVIPEVTELASQQRREPAKEPNIIGIMLQAMYIGSNCAVKTSLHGADVVIEPRVAHVGTGDFHRADELILQGELAAQGCIAEIKKKLGNIRVLTEFKTQL